MGGRVGGTTQQSTIDWKLPQPKERHLHKPQLTLYLLY